MTLPGYTIHTRTDVPAVSERLLLVLLGCGMTSSVSSFLVPAKDLFMS